MAATSTDILLRMCLDDRCCFEALDLINETSQSSANMTTRYIDKLEYDMRAEDTAWTVFAILCIASGFVLNALTIIVFVKGKRVPKRIKLLLINLAVADMCYSVVLPIKIMDYRLDRSLITTIMPCRIINYLYYVVLTVGPFCNLAVSLERLVIVYLPLKPLSAKAKSIIAVGVWVLALTSELGILVNTEMVHITDGDVYCSAVRSAYQQDECTLNTYVFMKILNILPIVLTISCYVLLAVKVSRRQQIGETRNPSSRQIPVMVVVDAVITFITWVPCYIFSGYGTQAIVSYSSTVRQWLADDTLLTVYRLHSFGACLILSNSFSTPIIYFIFNKSFRHDCRWLVSRQSQQSSQIHPSSSSIPQNK